MKKDVIYIDVEDDITAIIGKVKDASEKIVALVPPKRIGVLQSAVNLRLLARAADQSKKRLVLITNNPALTALSAAAQLPVAKNLQSKPEIAQIPALDIDDGDDIIDGAQLPIGDLERTADIGAAALSDPAVDEIIRADTLTVGESTSPRALPPQPGQAPVRPKAKSGAKVPNFNRFRKKLLLIGAGLLLLISFLVWAILFAPKATITITARTTEASMNRKVVIGETTATSASADTIKATAQQLKKTVSKDFDATEKKDVGEKATGTVSMTSDSFTALTQGISIPAGTGLMSTSGNTYTTDDTIVLSTTGPTKTVGITASDKGTAYNGATGVVTGTPEKVSGRIVDPTTGGTSKTITVVSAADVQRATDALKDEDTADIKKQLKEKFGDTAVVIDASFTAAMALTSSPAVGQEAAASAKLTGTITYSMTGVAKDELTAYLKDYFNAQLDDDQTQRVYDNGAGTVTFTNAQEENKTFSVNLSATAKVGPKIDDAAIKTLAKGKRFGEIQSSIEATQGVDNVDIKFSPFWVSKAPTDSDKITVEFKLDESK